MTKKEIFEKIMEITALVCDVKVDDMRARVRKEDVVTALTIVVFWADAAGFSVESLCKCLASNNANSVNVVKKRVEEYWREKFAFHMLVKDVGVRLHEYALSEGEDFDYWKPLRHMSKVTGKYAPPCIDLTGEP